MILSTRKLFALIFFIALFVLTARPVSDPDLWWHLRTGEYIVTTASVPHVDVFSATNAGKPWVAHEWLSELAIYLLYSAGSFPALIVVFSAVMTLAFVLVYARCEGRPYIAAAAALLAALASAPTWGVRPQILSLLMTCVFLWVLDRWDRGDRRLIWALVPLMILWVNLHSGFAVGLAILALYLAGNAASQLGAFDVPRSLLSHSPTDGATPSPQARTIAWRDLIRKIQSSKLGSLGLVSAACLLVVPLNPNGVTMYVYPFETLASRAMQTYIQEWFSPDFHALQFQPFAALLLATLAAVGLSGKRMSLTQTLLLALFGYAALRSARNIPLFAVIAAPILAEHVWHIAVSRGWARLFAESRVRSGRLVALNWVLLVLIAGAAIARTVQVCGDQPASERAEFPAAAVDFLAAEHVSGTIYNSYGWGGYLIWRLYPAARVFIDGRADVYGDAFIEEYLSAYRGEDDWRDELSRYGVHTVLLEPGAPLADLLAQDPVWRKTYADTLAIVYQRGP